MKRLSWIMLALSLIATIAYGSRRFYVGPGSYRAWNHVKSMVIFEQSHPLYNPFGGIHHVYVNSKGLDASKASKGRRFPDGSVLVFVLYEHKDAGGAYAEGKKKIEAFMVKNSKEYNDTGGWGFYAYDGSGKNIVKDQKNNCFKCHEQVQDKDFVFSEWTE